MLMILKMAFPLIVYDAEKLTDGNYPTSKAINILRKRWRGW